MPCSYCRINNHTVDRCHHGALLRSMHIFKYHIDPYNNFEHNRLWFVNNGMYPQHHLYDIPINGYNSHGVKLVKKYLTYVIDIARYGTYQSKQLSSCSNLTMKVYLTNILNNQIIKKFIQIYYDGPNNLVNMREIYPYSYQDGCNIVNESFSTYNFLNNVRKREIYTRDVQSYGIIVASQLNTLPSLIERYNFIRSLPLSNQREEPSNTTINNDVDEITTAAEILTTMNHDEVLENIIGDPLTNNNNDVNINTSIHNIDNRQSKIDKLILVEKPYESEECQICYDKIGCVNNITLRCGHKYCSDCFLTHFQNPGGTRCPCCKQDIAVRVDNWLPPKDESQENIHVRLLRRPIPSPPPPVRSNSVPNSLNNWINDVEDNTWYQERDNDEVLSMPDLRFENTLFSRRSDIVHADVSINEFTINNT